jgi:hypothetical protein
LENFSFRRGKNQNPFESQGLNPGDPQQKISQKTPPFFVKNPPPFGKGGQKKKIQNFPKKKGILFSPFYLGRNPPISVAAGGGEEKTFKKKPFLGGGGKPPPPTFLIPPGANFQKNPFWGWVLEPSYSKKYYIFSLLSIYSTQYFPL